MSKKTIPTIVQPIDEDSKYLKRALPTPLTVIQASIMSYRRNDDISDSDFANAIEMTIRTIMQTNDVRIIAPTGEGVEHLLLFEYCKRSCD